MLCELRAAGLGTIEDLVISFEPGFNVVTGETGAGKSLIVGALGLLLGGRADKDALRPDVAEAEIEGRFKSNPEAAGVLDDAGIPPEDEIVLVRRIGKSSSKAYANGRMVTAGLLAQVGATLVEVVGQHSSRLLVQSDTQRDALDRFGGTEVRNAGESLARTFRKYQDCQRELSGLVADPAQLARECENLEYQAREIDQASLEPAQDRVLQSEVQALANAEMLGSEVSQAQRLADDARDLLAQSAQRISGLTDIVGDALVPVASSLDTATVNAEEALTQLRSYLQTCEVNPDRLAEAQDRLALINDLKRKYGPELDDVITYGQEALTKAQALRRADETRAELVAKSDAAWGELKLEAEALTALRTRVAGEITAGIQRRLEALAMPQAKFCVEVVSGESIDRHGADAVRFMFGAGSDMPLRPMAKVASGGEVSRVMLAVAAELAGLGQSSSLVFDEIDLGTGGEVATTIGEMLMLLARDRQLVAITHLAQVASFANHHVGLHKSAKGTQARVLRATDRVVELSRMLSGSPNSIRARQHAEELLARANETQAQSVG